MASENGVERPTECYGPGCCAVGEPIHPGVGEQVLYREVSYARRKTV